MKRTRASLIALTVSLPRLLVLVPSSGAQAASMPGDALLFQKTVLCLPASILRSSVLGSSFWQAAGATID